MAMRKVLPLLLLIAACSRESGTLTRDQQQYETVQEGSALGVTSTVVVPGEVVVPPLTGTNADTTTAFTLPATSTPPTDTQQPGTLAGTLPMPPPAYVPPPVRRPDPPPTASVPEVTSPATEATTPEPEQPAEPETTEPEPERDEEQEDPPPPPPPGEPKTNG